MFYGVLCIVFERIYIHFVVAHMCVENVPRLSLMFLGYLSLDRSGGPINQRQQTGTVIPRATSMASKELIVLVVVWQHPPTTSNNIA